MYRSVTYLNKFIFLKLATVIVHNGDIEQAVMTLRKKMQREGIFKRYRAKLHFVTTARARIVKAMESCKRKARKRRSLNTELN